MLWQKFFFSFLKDAHFIPLFFSVSNVIVGFQMAGMLEFFGYFFIAYTLNMVPCAVLVCCLRDRMGKAFDNLKQYCTIILSSESASSALERV